MSFFNNADLAVLIHSIKQKPFYVSLTNHAVNKYKINKNKKGEVK